ncbi:hypothetical protein CP556_18410 [Natrinema sp. CBA1119]|uniref:DUF7344 domain-containing protein n=1 Tax=Natrinema sp. CBA1119 TaxID=1608465 RepID=UPI000BF99FBA|nr:hypothetical protein [Natrinema sp. CBA1119]PGF17882.1 hypothetical protein CP556_18410 [Natrinema sp. CBA1119]
MARSQLESVTERSQDGEPGDRTESTPDDRETSGGASTASSDAAERSPTLPVDDVFGILSNRRRRHTIAYLNENGSDPVPIRELAAFVAARENDTSVQDVTYKERKRVYTSLHQLHLEKMDDLGIVEYDRDRGLIERTETTERFGTYLDSVAADGIAWSDVSVAVATFCLVGVGLAWSGLVPIGSRAGFAVAFLVAAVFALVSSAHAVDARRER